MHSAFVRTCRRRSNAGEGSCRIHRRKGGDHDGYRCAEKVCGDVFAMENGLVITDREEAKKSRRDS